MLTVPVCIVCTVWRGRTVWTVGPYSGDVAGCCWLMIIEWGDETCPLVANSMRTRGPIHGRHVSLIFGSYGCCIKYMGVYGVRPRDLLPQHRAFAQLPGHWAIEWFLFDIWFQYILTLFIVLNGGGSGWGLAPTHGFTIWHMTIVKPNRAWIILHSIYTIYYIVLKYMRAGFRTITNG
jgi:hypothetical protein